MAKTMFYDTLPWEIWDYAVERAISLARRKKCRSVFHFNGIRVFVKPSSDKGLIFRDYVRAMNGFIPKKVGPFPQLIIEEKVFEKEKNILMNRVKEREEVAAKYKIRVDIEKRALLGRISQLPPMKLVDEKEWEECKVRNSDSYGKAILSCAENWARLMQVEMVETKDILDIMDSTFEQVDVEGFTGFMYGLVVKTLSQYWEYGEELRRFHNIKTQIGNEGEEANKNGGILNPAMLVIGI